MEIDVFVSDRSPGLFNVDVVPPIAAALHANPSSLVLQDLGERIRGELAPLVCIEESRLPKARYGLFQSLLTEY